MSEFSGLWKPPNNPACTKSVRAFRALKLDIILKKNNNIYIHSLQELTFLSMAGQVYLLRPEPREPRDRVAKWAMAEVEAAWELYAGMVAMPLCREGAGDPLGKVTDDRDGTNARMEIKANQGIQISSVWITRSKHAVK